MTSDETSVSEQNGQIPFKLRITLNMDGLLESIYKIFWPNKIFGFFRVLYVTDPFNLSRLVTYGK